VACPPKSHLEFHPFGEATCVHQWRCCGRDLHEVQVVSAVDNPGKTSTGSRTQKNSQMMDHNYEISRYKELKSDHCVKSGVRFGPHRDRPLCSTKSSANLLCSTSRPRIPSTVYHRCPLGCANTAHIPCTTLFAVPFAATDCIVAPGVYAHRH
jgi:hypothetical protein